MAASLLLPSSLPPSRSLLLPLLLSCLLLSASSLPHRLPRPFLDPDAADDLYTLDKGELGLISGGGADGYISSDPLSNDLLVAASTAANRSSSSGATARGLSAESSCEQPYGVLPCTDNVVGNLFLLAAYGYLLFTAAKLLSEGSELLLTVLDPGIIGGLLLPILGALPDSILILVSGLGGTQEEAQEQVLVGIGLLAGSIVMLLTLLWGTCLFLGRCDLEKTENGRLTAVDKKLTKKGNFTETGVESDELTKMSARIMTMSVIPFLVAQLSMLSSSGNIPVLVACILALGGLAAYCLYQVFTPWIQQRRKEIAQKQVIKFLALEKLQKRSGLDQKLVTENGDLNEAAALELFKKIDRDNDNILSRGELQGMLSATFHSSDPAEDPLDFIMREFDVDASQQITQLEFIEGMRKWCRELKLQPQHSLKHHREQAENYLEELQRVEEEEEEDAGESVPPSKAQIIRRAVFLLVVGTILAAVFADPLVDAVNDFSSASSIPSFFISFVLLPLASNSSEGVSSILFSARKKKKNMSLTYSQIYGGVTMNNTMGLGIFLAVVYGRGLVWDFSSEVLVVFLVTVFMGLVASFRSVFPAWIAFIALLLYPLSLGLVAVLDYVAGWE